MMIDTTLLLVDELNDQYVSALDDGQADLARAALDKAIGLLDGALHGTSPDHPLFPLASLTAASAYELRWQADGPPADLDAAITHARAGLRAGPGAGGEPADRAVLQLLGYLLGSRFSEAKPDPADRQAVAAARRDRDEAIACLDEAHQPASADLSDPDELDVCRMLGELYIGRHRDPWPDPADCGDDVAAAIAVLTVVASQTEPEQDDVAALVLALFARWDRSKDADDRDNFIRWGQLLMRLPDPEGQHAGKGLPSLLAIALLERAESAADKALGQADTDAAIGCLEAELAVTPADDPGRPDLIEWLAEECWNRLQGSSFDRAAVDRMTEYAGKAWELLPPGSEVSPERAIAGLQFAIGLLDRLARPGQVHEPEAVDLAIRILLELEQSEAASDPEFHRIVVTLLAGFQAGRSQEIGSGIALGQARQWIRQAAQELPLDDPETAFLVDILAGAFTVLAMMGTSAGDLDQAIGVLSASVSSPSGDPMAGALTRAALGMTLTQRAQLAGNPADLDHGIDHLITSWELFQDSADRSAVVTALISALLIRYQQRGDAQDIDAAEYYLAAAHDWAEAGTIDLTDFPDAHLVLTATRGMVRILRGIGGGDLTAIDQGISAVRAVLTGLSPDHPYYKRLQSDLGLGLVGRAAFGTDPAGDAQQAVELLDAVVAAAAPDDATLPMARMRLCGALSMAGLRLQDPGYLRQAIACAAAARDELPSWFGEPARFSLMLGFLHRRLFQLTRSQWDLAEVIRLLEESRRLLSGRPGDPLLGICLIDLARSYQSQPDTELALEAAQAALQERSRDVLLQTGTARSLGLARTAAEEAVEVAGWCLAEGNAEAAAEVLELGRGLILHSATAVSTVTDMLVQAGQPDLAAEWEAAPAAQQPAPWDGPDLPGNPLDLLGGSGPPQIPADLRGRVLNALTQAGTNPLLIPPACADMAGALAETGADALVYLLEPTGDGPGNAIIVPASARGDQRAAAGILRLPLLQPGRCGPLTRYVQADQELGLESAAGAADRAVARERWSQALDQLCGWAGPAVMAPLLEHVGRWALGRPPHLVLVPAGRLSLVPWHAARLDPVSPAAASTVSARYACTEAVISYAASGRQLVEVSKRQALALQLDPVVVGNPNLDLVFGSLEAHYIRARCYPAGRYLGRPLPLDGARSDGPGQPAEILHELPSPARPGASVVHLGCHARLMAAAPGDSYLELADGQRLAIETILRQAANRPAAAPGGLVCLAACSSAHGGAAHDEALSLSTAFLAAGATSVIGARWEVASGVTSVLMFMFHWFLAVEGQEPRDALRSAQLWLLDPDRTVPEQLPGELARFLPDPAGLAVADWAAFTHQGR